MSVCEAVRTKELSGKMAGNTKIKTYVKVLNKYNAIKLLDCLYEKQRPLKNWSVTYISKTMQDGKFAPGTPIDIAILNGNQYLINGQHRLHAVIEADTELAFTIIEHYVNSMDDIASLYTVIDRGAPRTRADSDRVFGMGEKYDLTNVQVNKLSAAIAFIMGNFKKLSKENKILDKEISEEYPKYIESYRAFEEAIEGCATDMKIKIHRLSPLSVALTTFLHQRDIAETFWRDVALDDGLRLGDPAKVLSRFILKVSRDSKRDGNCISNEYIARGVARAWNAYYEGERLEKITIKDPYGQIRIIGTPYE